ncbi:molybdopterin molybdochelatase [Arachidicoccus rhizosphaerae]|uniref:Molybdopterin molybdenumtransferase n=2 Tax=Arachidicoccus rhizosphaerae TaxID=551991 RepID=A0A1H3ZGI4_9BACT|nr:molybdopterin molybdochelatase [Arachidicoccus rhizosphaerae]
MVTVSEAEKIISAHLMSYGEEVICLEDAVGRVLAEDLVADRDLPPFNRATVDGIAIQTASVKNNNSLYAVCGIQAAGVAPLKVFSENHCIEIMTGAAVDPIFDAVIRYEDCVIEDGSARLLPDLEVKPGMNIHYRGKDKQQGEILAEKNRVLTPALIGLAASTGQARLRVKKLPRIVVISTGDEMVPLTEVPTAYQLRRSNGIVVKSCLAKYKIHPQLMHLNDELEQVRTALTECLQQYDVLIITGGVSMGKFDFIPQVLSELGVQKQFHKVRQRPGKPFWFGSFKDARQQASELRHPVSKLIFALPGNPVSVFMCLNRYFLPWLQASLGLSEPGYEYAVLNSDILFKPALQYFAQVKLKVNNTGVVEATPLTTNGSGDFSNLMYADAFMELPGDRADGRFKKGECFKVWRF